MEKISQKVFEWFHQKLKELTPTKGEESGSREIVDDNRCSVSKHRGTSIGHNRMRAFQGHSEHNN
ncbi:hypothetical protein HUJ05_000669 [Dendroctonus ponderosae]|nr:hypothetical protein HUJ05_000669 [Dendroctonus ponderosae]